MREWTPTARVAGRGERHELCLAAFFILMGALVFVVAVLAAFGIVNLLG